MRSNRFGNVNRFGTITVAELIERLQDEDPEARVIFSTSYGDYHNTPQALPISGDVEEVEIAESAYSNSGFAIVEIDDDDEDDEDDDTDADVETSGKFLVIR